MASLCIERRGRFVLWLREVKEKKIKVVSEVVIPLGVRESKRRTCVCVCVSGE